MVRGFFEAISCGSIGRRNRGDVDSTADDIEAVGPPADHLLQSKQRDGGFRKYCDDGARYSGDGGFKEMLGQSLYPKELQRIRGFCGSFVVKRANIAQPAKMSRHCEAAIRWVTGGSTMRIPSPPKGGWVRSRRAFDQTARSGGGTIRAGGGKVSAARSATPMEIARAGPDCSKAPKMGEDHPKKG